MKVQNPGGRSKHLKETDRQSPLSPIPTVPNPSKQSNHNPKTSKSRTQTYTFPLPSPLIQLKSPKAQICQTNKQHPTKQRMFPKPKAASPRPRGFTYRSGAIFWSGRIAHVTAYFMNGGFIFGLACQVEPVYIRRLSLIAAFRV